MLLDISLSPTENTLIKIKLSERVAAHFFCGVCAFLAAAMLWGWRMDSDLRGNLQRSGKRVEATVVAARQRMVPSGRTSRLEEYELSVIYMVDLKMISKDFRVTSKGFYDHPQGAKVPVLYYPESPQEAAIDGDFGLDSAGNAWIGGVIFAVLAAGLFLYAIRRKPPAPASP